MSHERLELERWLRKSGHSPRQIEVIFRQLDRFDIQMARESLFDDLAAGVFDIRPAADGQHPDRQVSATAELPADDRFVSPQTASGLRGDKEREADRLLEHRPAHAIVMPALS